MTSNPIQQYTGDEKLGAIQMLDLVMNSLEKTWTITPQKKKKKLEELEDIRQQILAIDDSKVGMVLENSMTSKCLPGLGIFGQRQARKELTNQFSATLHFLKNQTHSIRSNTATDGNNSSCRDADLLIDFDDSLSVDESAAGSTNSLNMTNLSVEAYDADGEQDDKNISYSSSKDSNTGVGFDDVLVTTSALTSDTTGPLGVSITTWRRHKLNDTRAKEKDRKSERSSTTEKDSSDEDEDDDAYQNSLEEISVSFGSGLVVRATTRTKTVRFANVKPTMEDNINRARELLKSASQMNHRHLRTDQMKMIEKRGCGD
jgi:hypothetical protein